MKLHTKSMAWCESRWMPWRIWCATGWLQIDAQGNAIFRCVFAHFQNIQLQRFDHTITAQFRQCKKCYALGVHTAFKITWRDSAIRTRVSVRSGLRWGVWRAPKSATSRDIRMVSAIGIPFLPAFFVSFLANWLWLTALTSLLRSGGFEFLWQQWAFRFVTYQT